MIEKKKNIYCFFIELFLELLIFVCVFVTLTLGYISLVFVSHFLQQLFSSVSHFLFGADGTLVFTLTSLC